MPEDHPGSAFSIGLDPWLQRLGNLRNVVRQELVARQLAAHLPATPARPLRVLDVGAGQGTQAIRLARGGHTVTAIEPDPRMRDSFETAAAALPQPQRECVTLLAGAMSDLGRLTSPAAYDVVLCHGVLMYLPEATTPIGALASRVAPSGVMSVVSRNTDAMAWRPASRHDWSGALAMLDEVDRSRAEGRDARYRNEIGADARADSIDVLVADCTAAGLEVERWYGIRVATDDASVDAPVPPPDELALVLEVEERLGRTDPYRRLGTLLHVIARSPAPSL